MRACPGGCYWVEVDLCSACRDREENPFYWTIKSLKTIEVGMIISKTQSTRAQLVSEIVRNSDKIYIRCKLDKESSFEYVNGDEDYEVDLLMNKNTGNPATLDEVNNYE